MTGLLGGLLLLTGVAIGLRLLLGLDARGAALRRLGGLALVAFALPVLLVAVGRALAQAGGGRNLALALLAFVVLVTVGWIAGRTKRPAAPRERAKARERIVPPAPGGAGSEP